MKPFLKVLISRFLGSKILNDINWFRIVAKICPIQLKSKKEYFPYEVRFFQILMGAKGMKTP